MAAVGGDGLEKRKNMIVRAAECSADHVRAAKQRSSGHLRTGEGHRAGARHLLSGGHGLLLGVPGLAKTKLVETMGTVLGLDARRIQFTPDLMPSDILGAEVLEESQAGKSASASSPVRLRPVAHGR